MDTSKNLCPSCFKENPTGASFCQRCGFDIKNYNHKESALPLFSYVNNQYMIGQVLGQGGFGITYKALDTFDKNHKIVAIKEYMPSDYAERHNKTVYPLSDSSKATRIFEHGKSSYIEEIKTLYQFKNTPGVVEIYSHFQENNTAYLVMEYLQGCSLKSYVRRCGGKLDVGTARNYIYDTAKALNEVHKAGVVHRDISPENIYLVNNEKDVKLIDFGAARDYIENSESEKSVLLKPGFAPPEQYTRTGCQGQWTDVYALAATLYYIVSGVYVQDSISRMQNDRTKPLCDIVPGVSRAMSNAVQSAMELDYKQRTKDCQQFMDDLDKTGWTTISGGSIVPERPPMPVVPPTPIQPPTPISPPVQIPPQRKRTICSIVCESGPYMGRKIDFYPGQRIRVGRLPNESELVVSNENVVSKRHCFVEYDMNRRCFIVTDDSTNGTFDQRGRRLIKGNREMLPNGSIVFLATQDVIIKFIAKEI